ncbi:hypothetical protein V7068_11520 [Bacillus sp. JJ634]
MKEKNEAGYTLVLVLLTITLIFIFSLTLISSVLNSANQNKKTEENIQLNRLSEMGVTYVEKAINKVAATELQSSSEYDSTNLADQYMDFFKNELKEYKLIPNQELEIPLEKTDKRFKIFVNSITLENATNTIKVTYTITASLDPKDPDSEITYPPVSKEVHLDIKPSTIE